MALRSCSACTNIIPAENRITGTRTAMINRTRWVRIRKPPPREVGGVGGANGLLLAELLLIGIGCFYSAIFATWPGHALGVPPG